MGWSATQALGLTVDRPQLTSKGYTLVVPLGGDSVFLVDMGGRFVHRWTFTDLRPDNAQLLESGNLLVMGLDTALEPSEPRPEIGDPVEPFELRVRRLGGGGSRIVEVTWDGEPVWEHADPALHHDMCRLPNGNTVFPVWVEMTSRLTKAVKGGHRLPKEKLGPMLGDDVVEVDPEGSEVRRVETWRLYDPGRDPICPLEDRVEWTHMNSVDVNRSGEILVSCRHNSRVSIIDTDGALAWTFGAPDISHQHHATWLANGNIQIFDNGMHRPRRSPSSKVVEVDRATKEVVWSYEGNPGPQFFSGHISGAVRLANHNTLITEGTSGRVFEVTRRGEVVWEWWNPVYNPSQDGTASGWLFRAYRYPPDHPAFASRTLDPVALDDLNRLYGLS